MATREEVYTTLNAERAYQDARWGPTDTKGNHSTAEFSLYMLDYMLETVRMLSRAADAEVKEKALANIRKITAMGVACMEQNGVVSRVGRWNLKGK